MKEGFPDGIIVLNQRVWPSMNCRFVMERLSSI